MYKCPICKRRFTSYYGIINHFFIKHFVYSKDTCMICGRKFDATGLLVSHLRKEALNGDALHGLYFLCYLSYRRSEVARRIKEIILRNLKVEEK